MTEQYTQIRHPRPLRSQASNTTVTLSLTSITSIYKHTHTHTHTHTPNPVVTPSGAHEARCAESLPFLPLSRTVRDQLYEHRGGARAHAA